MLEYIKFLIKKVLKRKQNIFVICAGLLLVTFVYVMNLNSQDILRDSLLSQLKTNEIAINEKKINSEDSFNNQFLQEEIDQMYKTQANYKKIIKYYENKQWDKFYDGYLNELNSQRKIIEQTQKLEKKDNIKDEYVDMIESTDKQINVIKYYQKNHLKYENIDYPIYGFTFTLSLFRFIFPILLTAINVYILAQVFTFDYVETLDKSRLLGMPYLKKVGSKIITGSLLVVGIFIIFTVFSIFISTLFTKNIGSNYPIILTVDNQIICLKAWIIFIKVVCMNLFYILFIILLSYFISLIIQDNITLLLILLCVTIGGAYLPNWLSIIKVISHLLPFSYINALSVIDGSLAKLFMNNSVNFNFGMMVLMMNISLLTIFIILIFKIQREKFKSDG